MTEFEFDDGDLRRAFEAGWAAAECMASLMSAREAYDLFLRTQDAVQLKNRTGRPPKLTLVHCANPQCGVLFRQRRRGKQRERFCSLRCVVGVRQMEAMVNR